MSGKAWRENKLQSNCQKPKEDMIVGYPQESNDLVMSFPWPSKGTKVR